MTESVFAVTACCQSFDSYPFAGEYPFSNMDEAGHHRHWQGLSMAVTIIRFSCDTVVAGG